MANFSPLYGARKKKNSWQADPSKLTTTTARRQPSYAYDYQAAPGGATQIRRQTTAQAARPPVPSWTPGGVPPVSGGARMYQTAVKPAGYDPTASQFPWQLRKGVSSDASRQAAFRYGFGGGEGRTGFARKATDAFFDPRYMFDPNFRNWALQQKLRRQYGL